MDDLPLPESLVPTIRAFVAPHPCAVMIADFYQRIGYCVPGDEEGEDLRFCLHDYRAEPDYFDCRHDGKRGCVRAFYRWGTEWDDPRLHGGRW